MGIRLIWRIQANSWMFSTSRIALSVWFLPESSDRSSCSSVDCRIFVKVIYFVTVKVPMLFSPTTASSPPWIFLAQKPFRQRNKQIDLWSIVLHVFYSSRLIRTTRDKVFDKYINSEWTYGSSIHEEWIQWLMWRRCYAWCWPSWIRGSWVFKVRPIWIRFQRKVN
jgi:hypothetical protein